MKTQRLFIRNLPEKAPFTTIQYPDRISIANRLYEGFGHPVFDYSHLHPQPILPILILSDQDDTPDRRRLHSFSEMYSTYYIHAI